MSNTSSALKSLQSQLSMLQEDLGLFKKQRCELDQQIKTHERNITSIVNQINNLQSSDAIVSEHAIIRYLERKYTLNMQEIVDEILTKNNRSLIEFSKGNCKIRSGEIEFVVKNNVVVTVVDR